MKRRFFNTRLASTAGLEKQMPRVLKYIVDNRTDILPQDTVIELASSIRSILKSPLSEFFDRIVSAGGLRNFAAIFVRGSASSLPELLTSSSITLDTKQINEVGILRSIPEVCNKVLVNLTPTLRFDKHRGGFEVNAVDQFQTLFVRGHLVASFQDSDNWLPPFLAEYTVKSYSMLLSGLISRFYGLSLPETLKVMGVLAFFFCHLLASESENPMRPGLFNRCTYIGNRGELLVMSEEIEEFYKTKNYGTEMSLDHIPELIAHFGPSRLSKFDFVGFQALCGGLGPDLLTSLLALEYPPYWVYLLVAALSGAKVPLIYKLNEQRLVQEGRTKFLNQLMSAESIFDVRR